jgi:hypothetical protein
MKAIGKGEKMKRILASLLAAVLIVLLGTSVGGAVILDFNIDANQSTSPSINFAGGNNPMIGADIEVDDVSLNGGPPVSLSNATLDFTTGNVSSFTDLTGVDLWTFGPGGTVTITGGFPAAAIPDGSILLSGTFTSATSNKYDGTNFFISGGVFTDEKNPDLLSYFGLPTGGTWDGGFNISFFGIAVNGTFFPKGFASTAVQSGNVVNTPLPSTALLLASSLIGLGILGRRRSFKGKLRNRKPG